MFCKFSRQWLIVSFLFTASIVLFLNIFPRYYTGHKTVYAPVRTRHLYKEYELEEIEYPKEEAVAKDESTEDVCETIHIGIVNAGYKSTVFFHTLIKSIMFHRANPVHLHIVTNKQTELVLNTLLHTWELPKVNFTLYDLEEYVHDVRWIPNGHYSGVFGLLKLLFPKIVPLSVTNKIIILDTDVTLVSDIYELWKLFSKFNKKQAIGIVENQSDYYLGNNPQFEPWPAIGRGFNSGVLLYHLQRLKALDWPKLWSNVTKRVAMVYGKTRLADQDIINAVFKEHNELLYEVPCYWNTQLSDHTLSESCYKTHKAKIIHWNSPKKFDVINKDKDYFKSLLKTFQDYNGNLLRKQLLTCNYDSSDFKEEVFGVCEEFQKPLRTLWRTLLYFRNYKYIPLESDVTFVAQLSYDRLQTVEEIAKSWTGPISLTLYVTDPELEKSLNFIENSDILSERLNIAYHAVFKEGEYYPINALRNVALKTVNTTYVFLADIDFVPMIGLYDELRAYLLTQRNLKKKALIVAAFEMTSYMDAIPRNKTKLLKLLKRGKVEPFLQRIWSPGHSPTNFEMWKTSTEPYKVKWAPDFEPYIVVENDIPNYDERFVGFGWNKVSHIMELEAQNYEFIVLPNTFIVHKPHSPSYDISRFRTSPTYRLCLQLLKEEFIQYLNKKYKRNFEYKNITVTFPTQVKRKKRNYRDFVTTEETNTDYPSFNLQK